MRKKIEQDLFKKRIEKEISIVKEMISEFDVIKKRVIELNEQARYFRYIVELHSKRYLESIMI